jgi:hypothetical protein
MRRRTHRFYDKKWGGICRGGSRMNLGFGELIRTIESEIKTEYLPGAIQWADENFDDAWSMALNRFDASLTLAIERKDYSTAQIEGDFYRATILDLLRKYKTHHKIKEVSSFLDSIGGEGK